MESYSSLTSKVKTCIENFMNQPNTKNYKGVKTG